MADEFYEETSILNSVKKRIGPSASYDYFNHDIVSAINSAFTTLHHLGVGKEPFRITSEEEEWDDFSTDKEFVAWAKDYVYLKTRLLFDPPTNSFLLESIKDQIKELEWRINDVVDFPLDDVH